MKFFPGFTGEGRETITIRNLLTHTAGLPDMLANDEGLRQSHAPLSEYREGALKAPLKFKPGSSYSYASMGILLSAEIAQKITGKPIADMVEERVFRPLGMRKYRLWPARPDQCHHRTQPGRARHDRGRQEKLE